MKKWRQDSKTGKMIPIDTAAREAVKHAIHGDIDTFVSPVDGTVISGRRALAEHNKRNNVVNAAEFTPEFYARKAKERADFYQGKRPKAEVLKRKREIYETWMRAERNV